MKRIYASLVNEDNFTAKGMLIAFLSGVLLAMVFVYLMV